MKIYTKTGDDGTTGLFGGGRISKASVRVAAYGSVDELNACLGLARSSTLDQASDDILFHLQIDLFSLGAELACVPGKESKLSTPLLSDDDITRLESSIDSSEEGLAPLTNFILPGGSSQASSLHLARTICRRAERAVLEIEEGVRPQVVVYLNRLSDLLFVLARKANQLQRVADVPWQPRNPHKGE